MMELQVHGESEKINKGIRNVILNVGNQDSTRAVQTLVVASPTYARAFIICKL